MSDTDERWQRHLAEERAAKAESLLQDFATGRDLLRAKHVKRLGEKIKSLRRIVRQMQKDAERKNTLLQVTGLIVNCTSCDGPANVTEEQVKQVEQIAKRLRMWLNNSARRRRPA